MPRLLQSQYLVGFLLMLVQLDEPYLRTKGVTDFSKYQCVPGSEPPNINDVAKLVMGAGDKSTARRSGS